VSIGNYPAITISETKPRAALSGSSTNFFDSGGIDGPLSHQLQLHPFRQEMLDDALTYLDQIKARFSDNPEVYNSFLDALKDYSKGIIDTPGVIDRVSLLFLDEYELLAGFTNFLPPGYNMGVSHDTRKCMIKMSTPMGTEHEMVVSTDCPKPAKCILKRKSPSHGDHVDNQASPYSSPAMPTKRLRTSLITSSRPKRPKSSVSRRAPKRAHKKKSV
jgi:histone deacetylase complex regulatory component SIN3